MPTTTRPSTNEPTAVLEDLRGLLAGKLDLEPDQIAAEADFEKDLGMDSLDRVDFELAAQEHFGIDIPDTVPPSNLREATDAVLAALASREPPTP